MTKVYGQCDAHCRYEVLTKKDFVMIEGTTGTSAGSNIEQKEITTIKGTKYMVVSAMMKETPIEGMVTTSENFQTGYSLPIPNAGGITVGVPTVILDENEASNTTTIKFDLQEQSSAITYEYRILLLETTDCATRLDVLA